jgi:metal-responsive CopG/Arc/MetJ family transcriptional regulator
MLRLPRELERMVDGYAKTAGYATRSEAIRQLIRLGLSTHYEAEHKRLAPKRSRMKRGGQ